MKKHQAHKGDVFAIPLGNGDFAYGQLAIDGLGTNCYIVFDFISAKFPDVTDLVKHQIIIRVLMVDAFLEHGCWTVIGNTPPPAEIYFPEYKLSCPPNTKVTDFAGHILRKATKADEERLDYRGSVNSSLFESVVKAKFGQKEWKPYMNEYLYTPSFDGKNKESVYLTVPDSQGVHQEQTSSDIAKDEEALFIIFPFNPDDAGFAMLGSLEDALTEALESQSVRELDGNEIGLQEKNCTIFIYGADTDRLLEIVRPVLANFIFPPESYLIQRYGIPGAREIRIPLT